MELYRQIKAFLMILVITLAITETTVLSAPAPRGDVVEESTKAVVIGKNTTKEGDIRCGNKGRFCELLCKNNPAEGGKMCNCDAYALKSSSASNLNRNKYIRVDPNSSVVRN